MAFFVISIPNAYSLTFDEQTCLSLLSPEQVQNITEYDNALNVRVINSDLESLNEGVTSGCTISFENEDRSFTLAVIMTISESDRIAQSNYGDLFSSSHRSGYPVTEGNNGTWIYHLVDFNDKGLGSGLFSIKDNIQIGINAPQTEFPINPPALIEIVKILHTNIDGQSEDIKENSNDNEQKNNDSLNNSEGGGCLIATATYGSELAPQVQFLREIRDNTVLSTASGASFMTGFNSLYYSFSPTIADLERDNPVFQEAVRVFITPMISTLSIMTLADPGSESDVLGFGISVIALNLGMYIAAPAVVGFAISKRLKSRKHSKF